MQAPVYIQAGPPPSPVNPSKRLPGSELCSYQLRSLLCSAPKTWSCESETRACGTKLPHLGSSCGIFSVHLRNLIRGAGPSQPLGMTAQGSCSRSAGPLQPGLAGAPGSSCPQDALRLGCAEPAGCSEPLRPPEILHLLLLHPRWLPASCV